MKSLILILITTICFAKTQIPLDLEGAEKYFTKAEIKKSLEWQISVDGVRQPAPSKIPFVKIYDNKELKGNPVAEIKKEGLFLRDKRICHFEKVHGGMSLLIDDKLKGSQVDQFSSPFGDQKEALCDFYPLRISEDTDQGNEGTGYEIKLIVHNQKIAEFSYKKEDFFFDVTTLLLESNHIIKDTETILQESLSDDEMVSLNKAGMEFREFLNSSPEAIYKKILEKANVIKTERSHRSYFCAKNKELFISYLQNEEVVKDLKKSTFLRYMKFSTIGTSTDRLKLVGFITNKNIPIYYSYQDQKWFVSHLQVCGI